MGIELKDIEKLTEKISELHKALSDFPQVLEYMRLAANMEHIGPVIVPQEERWIRAGDAASILGIGKPELYRLVKERKLQPYYIDESNKCMRFKLSDILSIPQPVAELEAG